MANIDDLLIPSLTLDEVAAPSTPAATSVVVYAKADGLVYSKDDAGTEKLMSSGPAAGISSGTSNPGSPSTNDQFFRTDLGLLIYYNGTRWLTLNLYTQEIPLNFSGTYTYPLTATATAWRASTWNDVYDLWLVDFYGMTFVSTTNDGSQFWTCTLRKETREAVYALSDIVNFTTGTGPDTHTQFFRHTVAIGALLGTSHGTLVVTATKTSTPGALTGVFKVTYRVVIT